MSVNDNDNENIDPNPDVCGICYEPYETETICRSTKGANDRCPSNSCRHAMCLQCAIQHAFASSRTACPFCRAPGAYSGDEFSALLSSHHEEEETSTDAAAAALTPQVLELLQAAKAQRDEARAEREAFFQSMQAIHHAMLVALMGEDAVNAIPDDVIIGVRVRLDADGTPVFSLGILTPRDDDDDAVDSSEAAAEELD